MSLTLLSELPQRLDRRLGCCVLIAVKQRVQGKGRLAGRLAVPARVELVRSMLARVLEAARAAQTVRQVFVVSPERDTVPDAIPVLADSGQGLNEALIQSHRALLELGVRELLVLHADLPEVTPGEIDILVRAGRGAGFAIAPDTADTGSNALCLATGAPFQFQFGPDSKRRHLQEARRLGLRPRIVRLPGLQFDIDTAEDLRRLEEGAWAAQLGL